VGFGTLGSDQVPTFLLPANPSAALVAFEVLVRPLIQIIRGQRQATRRVVRARTIAAIDSAPRRRAFIRGQLMRDRETREFLVDPLGAVGGGEPTHLLGSYGQANCLITVPAEETHVAPGQWYRGAVARTYRVVASGAPATRLRARRSLEDCHQRSPGSRGSSDQRASTRSVLRGIAGAAAGTAPLRRSVVARVPHRR